MKEQLISLHPRQRRSRALGHEVRQVQLLDPAVGGRRRAQVVGEKSEAPLGVPRGELEVPLASAHRRGLPVTRMRVPMGSTAGSAATIPSRALVPLAVGSPSGTNAVASMVRTRGRARRRVRASPLPTARKQIRQSTQTRLRYRIPASCHRRVQSPSHRMRTRT